MVNGNTLLNAYSHGVLRWRWLIIIGTLLFVVWAASGMRLLRFDSDYRVFFSEQNPQLVAFEELQKTYTKNDNILFVLAPKSGEVFSRETLAVVKELTEAAWHIPYSLRVDSITNYQQTTANGDDLVVADLVPEPRRMEDGDLERVRSIALSEPLLLNRVIAPKGDVTGVNVTVHLPGRDQIKEVPEATRFARGLVDKLRANHPEIDIYLTGMVIMNNAFPEATLGDMRTLVPIMFLVVVGAVWLMIRSLSGTLVTVLIILFSIVTGMGLGGHLGYSISGPVASAPTIILTMGVADCIHLLMTTLFLMNHDGMEKKAALVESLRVNFNAVFLTSFTTVIGFLTMNSSEVPPFRVLGNIVAIGVVAAWVYAILFLPAAMSLLPVKARLVDDRSAIPMDRLANFVLRQRHRLLWGTALFTLAMIACIPLNSLNDEFVTYFDKRIPFRSDTDFVSERLTGIYLIDFSIKSGQPGGISDPAFLATVEAFANWARQQPEVGHVNSITDVFKKLNRSMHGDDDAWRVLPKERDLAAQYLLLYEMSLPYGLDLNNQINVDKSSTRLNITLHNISSNAVLGFADRARAWLHDNAPPVMQAEGSSPTVMFANIGARNIRSMLLGSLAAMVLISLSLMYFLRAPWIGLLSMIPNLLPVAIGFGIWGLLVGEVGLALSVVASTTMGIVVDDTIHFLSKYLQARREKGLPPEEAIRYAFHSVGNALWVTSVVLVSGFMVLTFSLFHLNSGMGMLTGLVLALAMLLDFLMLPPLLLLFDRGDAR